MLTVLEKARQLTADRIAEGGWAVDATLGNGYDVLHLARCVGREGTVVGFDVQREAVDRSRRRLANEGLAGRVRLLHAGHEEMGDRLPEEARGRVQAVMFNLGYLPRSDRRVITRPSTTITALAQSLEILAPGGVVTLVCYRGHEGGAREYEAVRAWAERRDRTECTVLHYRVLNRPNRPPELIALETPA